MANSYNPNDATQTTFLAAIAKGESGAYANPASVGFGGVNLAGSPTDSSGFPLWAGGATSAGTTHAAGLYQFQPGTFDPIAKANGLNFQNPADQSAAAWILASGNYSKANNGASLETALKNGDYAGVAATLGGTAKTWSSLTTGELSSAFAGTLGAPGATGTGASASGAKASASGAGAGASGNAGLLATFEADTKNMFVRGGAIATGLVILAGGIFYLARDNISKLA